MRRLLSLFVLASLLTGCACDTSNPNESVLEIRNPLARTSRPVIVPQGYAIQVPAPAVRYQMVQVQEQAPAAAVPCAPAAPAYTPGYRWQPAPGAPAATGCP